MKRAQKPAQRVNRRLLWETKKTKERPLRERERHECERPAWVSCADATGSHAGLLRLFTKKKTLAEKPVKQSTLKREGSQTPSGLPTLRARLHAWTNTLRVRVHIF